MDYKDPYQKVQSVYENTILTEFTKAKFEKEIDRAKKNKNRLTNLKKTIQGMANMGLSKDDVSSLVSKIDGLI